MQSAKGEDCQIRLPGCNHNPETTVFCHMNGGGMGTKHSDIFGAYGCSECHLIVDTNGNREFDRDFIELAHCRGMLRTQQILLDKGLIKI